MTAPVQFRPVRPEATAAPAPQLDDSQPAAADPRGGPTPAPAGAAAAKTP